MKYITFPLLTVALACQLASAATITGTTVGDPTWRRPVADGNINSLSLVGFAVPFDVYRFTVSLSGTYDFLETATGNWDNYTFLYKNSFSERNQLANVIAGNDDRPRIGVSGFTAMLSSGIEYFFVSTGFDNWDSGAFSLVITGPGTLLAGGRIATTADVNNVPEPATLSLAAVGVGLLLFRKLRS